ncbi:MAG: flagellar basal body protein FliL [Deltaproteobacteria bacterium]|nr:flagellar basal body protein FliL [Deltaproteobacteria bacterium]
MASERSDETKDTENTKSSSMKLILTVALTVLLAGGGGFFAYTKFFKKDTDAHAQAKGSEPVIQEVETFLVNLSDPGGKRYLKLTMKARLSGKELQEEFVSRTFEIRDAIIMLLSSKEFQEIAKPEDKATLKQEIIFQLNRLVKKGQVQDIYFTEFLVQ